MPKWVITLLKLAVTIGGLAFILTQIHPGDTLRQLLRAHPLWLLLALLLVMSSLILRAFRWQLLLRGLGVRLSLLKLVRLYYIGHFFNAFLPTGFGGDILRVVEVRRYVGADVAAGTVLLDRLTGLLMLFVLALVALPWRPATLAGGQVRLLLFVSVVGLVTGITLLDGRLVYKLGSLLPAYLSPSNTGVIARLLRAVRAVGWPAVRGAFLVSLLFNLLQIAWWWAAARALGLSLPLTYLFLVVPLLALSLLVPAVAGFGAREAVATLLFDGAIVSSGGAPLAAGTGFALSALVFLIERLSGLPGGPLYLWTPRSQRESLVSKDEADHR
jgi:glycosyltransferase 2 family protein